MAVKCSPKVGKEIENINNKDNIDTKQDFKNQTGKKFNDVLTKNNEYSNVENKSLFANLKKGFKKVQNLFSIKEVELTKDFVGIKNGVDSIMNFTPERSMITSIESNYNRTHEIAVSNLEDDFRVNKLDANGNPIDGEYEQLSSDKVNLLGNYQVTRLIVSMYEEDKKLYFKNEFVNMLENPEQYGLSKDDALEYREFINENIELQIERFTEKAKQNYITKEISKYALENEIKNKDVSEEIRNSIKLEADSNYVLEENRKSRIEKEAKKIAEDRVYADFLQNDFLPVLKNQVETDVQMSQALAQSVESDNGLRKELHKAYKNIGKETSYLFKRTDDYFKAIIRSVNKAETTGRSPSALGIDLSSFVGQKGSYSNIYTNMKISKYVYTTTMMKNIYHAELVARLNEYNVTTEMIKEYDNELNVQVDSLNDRLLNPDKKISINEEKKIANSVYRMNKNIASKYPGLTIDGTNIRQNRSFKNTSNNKVDGSIYQELNNNLEIAYENEKNGLKSSYLDGELDSFFEEDDEALSYQDVKSWFDGDTETISKTRIIKFAKRLEGSPRIFSNKINVNTLLEINSIKNNLDATLINNGKLRLGNLLKDYLYDKDGNERYIMVDERGNKLTGEQQNKIGSMWFEDFDPNQPDAFAEFLAEKFFVDENLNNTTDFLKSDKIKLLPKPLADSLENVQNKLSEKEDNILKKSLKKITTYSKIGLLHSPFQFLGFTTRNTISDTYYMLQSQPQAIKELGPKGDVFFDIWQYFTNKTPTEDFQRFLQFTEAHYRVVYDDIFADLSMGDVKNLDTINESITAYKESIMSKYNIDPNGNYINKATGKVVSAYSIGIKYFNFAMKKYFTGVSKISETRELILRYAVYKSKMKEFMGTYAKDGAASTNNFGASKRRMIQAHLDKANSETEQWKKEEGFALAAIEYANQSLVAYKDSSPGVDSLSRYLIPFLRFTEGNIRLHYRLMENFVYNMADSINMMQSGDIAGGLKFGAKTLGKGMYNSSLTLGIPMMMWNAAMLALQGMDEEDIPEYYAENGYTVAPPLLNMFGYDEAILLSSTDVYSEMMSIIALDDLNTNIQNALMKSFRAIGKDDLEADLFNDIADAMIDSFDTPLDMAKAIQNKAISMANPFLKSAPELISGKDYYPEGPVSVGYKYTLSENAVRKLMSSVGLQKPYTVIEQAAGTPRGMDIFESFGLKTIGTQQDAWQQQRSLAYSYGQDVLGKEPFSRTGYGDETDYKRDEIYNMIKYGRYEDAMNNITNYVLYLQEEGLEGEELVSEVEALQTSLKNRFNVIPSTAIPQSELQGYVDTLSDEQINKLLLAYEYQRNITGPFYEWLFE